VREKRRQASAPATAARAATTATLSSDPAVGSSASNVAALSVSRSFGTCSSAFPLVGSESVSTRRQKRSPFSHGAPVRRW
jgi:hypothetical protein